MRRYAIRAICLIVAILSLLSGCSSGNVASTSEEFFAMDTFMRVTVYGDKSEEMAEEAKNEIERIDELLSISGDSEIADINAHGGGRASPETRDILERAIEIERWTDGAFDITLYPVVDAWGFFSGEYRIPDNEEIKELLLHTGIENININEDNSVVFAQQGMGIDLGGIGKGYAGQRVHDILAENGVSSALMELGGNICLLGTKPDGSLWRVAIMSPFDTSDRVGVIEAKDVSIVTSGGYQRYFEEDGTTYHHIIDPSTGFPADSGLMSVTIVCSDGLLADALSTALFVMGEDEACRFWRENGGFEMLLVTDDGRIVVSSGIEDSFQPEDGYTTEVVSR